MSIVLAVVRGVAVLFAGNLPWGFLLAPANLRFGRAVPWAVIPMAVWLWVYWKFIRGDWGASETAASRRACLRANSLSADVWTASLLSGLLGFAALFAFVSVMSRLVTLPASAPLTPPEGMPTITAFLLLTMSSIVAGVTEESAFRGYMQTPIERHYGLALALLVNGTVFGLLHFPNHPADVVTMLPYYLAVSAVYGGLTWAANSILPALVLHSGGDVWSLGRLWMTGQPEWQLASSQPALIRDTGVDSAFLFAVAFLVAFAGLTMMAFSAVRRLRDGARA